MSLPVRGAWVEIYSAEGHTAKCSRSPCGERGLKFAPVCDDMSLSLSLPVRGAWVEMMFPKSADLSCTCRSPCGERGLKLTERQKLLCVEGVAPRAGSVG